MLHMTRSKAMQAPGKARLVVYVEGHGCTQNMGETFAYREAVTDIPGVAIVDDPKAADVCLIGSCAVIDTTVQRILDRLKKYHGMGKVLALSGCMSKVLRKDVEARYPGIKIFGFTDTDEFRSWILKIADIAPKRNAAAKPLKMKAPVNPKTAIIPISQGCMGACSYCITRLARGKLRSYPPEKIIARAKELIDAGYKEILLTGQDTAVYGMDIGENLPELVKNVAKIDPPDGVDYRLRVGMMNPTRAKDIVDGLIGMYKTPRVWRFLHIPVQSGDDEVLKRMRRGYTVEDFRTMLRKVRKDVPDITLSTDVIVGFPGETYEDLKRSMALMTEVRPDILNITRFSPRPGTEAKAMRPRVYGGIRKVWSKEFTELRIQLGNDINKGYIGKQAKAMVTEHGYKGTFVTRLDNYKVVTVREKAGIDIGDWVEVEITGATDLYAKGKIVKNVVD